MAAVLPVRAQVPVEGQILVKLTDQAYAERLLALPAATEVIPLLPAVDGRFVMVKYEPAELDLDGMLALIGSLDCVEKVQPDLKFTREKMEPSTRPVMAPSRSIASDSPDDPLFAEQWGLQAIRMPELWKIPRKDPSWRPVIAILDDGFDLEHPDLVPNYWINEAELNGLPGVDDDGNGYIDDIRGWNVADGNDDLSPNDLHGTHCAGIAAAVADNGIGIAGANPDALIMPVKVFCKNKKDETQEIKESAYIWGINYAVASGADVLSMSAGFEFVSGKTAYSYCTIFNDIYESVCRNLIMVVAAGNQSMSITDMPDFPASLPSIIAVESSDRNGQVSDFSNFDDNGPWILHDMYDLSLNYELRAPGREIVSTVPGPDYSYEDGTSMAAPLVAGLISRLISVKDYTSNEELLRDLILSRGPELGIVDAMKAFEGPGGKAATLQIYTSDETVDVGQTGVGLKNVTAINLSDSTLTGLKATLSILGSDAEVVNGTQAFGPVGPGKTISLSDTDIVYSISDQAVPGSEIPVRLVLTDWDVPVDTVSLTVRVSGRILREDGLVLEVADDRTSLDVIAYEGVDGIAVIPDTVYVGNIPMAVKRIKNTAFAFSDIIHVTLPETLEKIGYAAFYLCTNLKSIDIPGNVRMLDFMTFNCCFGMESVTLHEGLEEIGGNVFEGCNALAAADIPATVTRIGEYAFRECAHLVELELHEGLKEIQKYAFSKCRSLAGVTLPASLDTISPTAFWKCSALRTVTSLSVIPPASDSLSIAYDKYEDGLAEVYGKTNIEPAIKDHDMNELEYRLRAFFDNYGPEAMDVLLELYGDKISEEFGEDFLAGLSFELPFDADKITLYVPEGCADAYRAAVWWGDFGKIVEISATGVSSPDAAPAYVPSVSGEYRVNSRITIRDGRKYFGSAHE